MFFFLSKILFGLIRPILWLLILPIWNYFSNNIKIKKRTTLAIILIIFLCSNKVVVNELSLLTEYPPSAEKNLPKTCVILGGFCEYDESRNKVVFNEAAERLFIAIDLYQKKLIDTIIISGGSGMLLGKKQPESVFARKYLINFGIDSSHIFFESNSKNTFENAFESKKILTAIGNRKITLITSAFHMPRARRCFDKQKIVNIPLPVHYISSASRGYNIADYLIPSPIAFMRFEYLLKEWVGLIIYKLTGKI